jgi:hypothetical protein
MDTTTIAHLRESKIGAGQSPYSLPNLLCIRNVGLRLVHRGRRITIMESEPGAMNRESTRRAPRRVVASYGSYAEAQKAVDYLSDEGFPVERVSIVAEDLRFVEQVVEQVTGRMGYGQAALQGAGLGALIGLIFGFFLGLFSFFNPLISAIYLAIIWLIYGAIIGLIVGLIGHALSGGQRDFSSVGRLEAGHYNVIVDEEVAEEASRLLARMR